MSNKDSTLVLRVKAVGTKESADDITNILRRIAKNTRMLQKEQEKAARETENVSKKMNKMSYGARVLKGALERLGHRGIDVLLRSLVKASGALKDLVVDTANFGLALAEVDSLITGTFENMQGLRNETLMLAASFGSDPIIEAKAAYTAYSAGVTESADALHLLRVANELAMGGLIDTDQAIDGITTLLKSFNLDVEMSALVANNLFVTMQKGKLRMGEIVSDIGRLASASRDAGITMEEMLSGVAAITTVGIKTDMAVVSLTQAIKSIVSPGKEAQKLFKDLKLGWGTAAIAGGKFGEFIVTLTDKLKGNADGMNTIFNNVRAYRAVGGLAADGLDKYTKTLEAMTKETGAAEIAIHKIMDTTATQAKILRSSVNSLATSFTDVVVNSDLVKEYLKGVNDAGFSLLTTFITLTSEMDLTGDGIRTLGKNHIGNLLLWFGELLYSATNMIHAFTMASRTIDAMGTSMANALRLTSLMIPGLHAALAIFEEGLHRASGLLDAVLDIDKSRSPLEITLLNASTAAAKAASAIFEMSEHTADLATKSSNIKELRDRMKEIQDLRDKAAAEARAKAKVLGAGEDNAFADSEKKRLAGLKKFMDSYYRDMLKSVNKLARYNDQEANKELRRIRQQERAQLRQTKIVQRAYQRQVTPAIRAAVQGTWDLMTGQASVKDVVLDVGKAAVRAGIMWLTEELSKRAATALTSAFTNTATSLDVGIKKVASKAKIISYSAEAAAAVYAQYISMPVVGEVLAPIMSAKARAGVLAAGAFKDGGVLGGNDLSDTKLFRGQSGERILSLKQTRDFDSLVKSMNHPGSKSTPIRDPDVIGGANSRRQMQMLNLAVKGRRESPKQEENRIAAMVMKRLLKEIRSGRIKAYA